LGGKIGQTLTDVTYTELLHFMIVYVEINSSCTGCTVKEGPVILETASVFRKEDTHV